MATGACTTVGATRRAGGRLFRCILRRPNRGAVGKAIFQDARRDSVDPGWRGSGAGYLRGHQRSRHDVVQTNARPLISVRAVALRSRRRGVWDFFRRVSPMADRYRSEIGGCGGRRAITATGRGFNRRPCCRCSAPFSG